MENQKYDVVVAGAGPAGALAARRTARKGLKTLLLEEHREIGWPVHCSGWLNGCPYTEKLVDEFGRDKIITKVDRWRVWTPSGEMAYEMKFNGGYFVDRINFDQFLVKKAVQAGSELSIRTTVDDVIKEGEKIKGVIAKKDGKTFKIFSDILLGCDGSRSIPGGIAKKSGILKFDKKRGREYWPGIQVEFLNIEGMEPGVIECFFGKIFDEHLGSAFISPLEKGHGMIGFGTFHDYLNVKENHPVFKQRLKNAQEVGMRGGLYGVLLGESLRKATMDGLILCGDAAGYHGITPAAISGSIASDVAVEACNAKDFTSEFLAKYDTTRSKHKITNAKLGLSVPNLPEDKLGLFLKSQGIIVNKQIFKDLELLDYDL